METVTKAFLKIGLKPGDKICIVATNRPEWCFSHFGAIEAGGIAVGIYQKYKKETILYCLKNCSANIFILENIELLNELKKIEKEMPQLEPILFAVARIQSQQRTDIIPGISFWKSVKLKTRNV